MRRDRSEGAGVGPVLHRWDARYRLVGLLVLVFSFSFIEDLRLVPAMILVTAGIYTGSGVEARWVLRRLRFPSFILLVLVLTLPFLSGEEVVASVGPLAVRREGILGALLIASRFVCIVTAGIILLGSTAQLTNIKAMRALGVPHIMADMALLTFRYLYQLEQDLKRMITSMKLRGFREHRLSPGGLRTLGWLSGSLLVRSHERSEWVYRAMIVRGYGEVPGQRAEFQAGPRDVLLLAAFVLIAGALVGGDILLGHSVVASV